MTRTIEIVKASHARLAVVTSDTPVILIGPGDVPAGSQILVEGEHGVLLQAGLDVAQVSARDCEVRIEGGVKLLGLAARRLIAEGDLRPGYGLQIAGDARIAGRLAGDRQSACRIGGTLSADVVDLQGSLAVDGDLEARRIDVRSLHVGGAIRCPVVQVRQQASAARREEPVVLLPREIPGPYNPADGVSPLFFFANACQCAMRKSKGPVVPRDERILR